MERDFEQIIGDVRHWLSHKKPTITRKNPARTLGRYRNNFDLQTHPNLCFRAFEVSSLLGDACLYGGVEVVTITNNGHGETTQMAWDEDGRMNFSSLLTGSQRPVFYEDLPGVILDRLYAQIAFPLQKVMNT